MTDGTNPVIGLEPCPFCRGPAVNVGDDYITCGAGWNPGCAGHMVRTDPDTWNTRAAPPANPVIVERVFAEPVVEQSKRLEVFPLKDESPATWIMRVRKAAMQAALEAMPDEVEGVRRFISIVDSTEETGFDPHVEQQLMDLADELRPLAKVSGVSK